MVTADGIAESMMEQIRGYYNGTGGFVERPASRERAYHEALNGKFSEQIGRAHV